MSIGQILVDAGVASILIIDDGYDEVPHPNDMVGAPELFADFFDDLGEEDEQSLSKIFSEFDPADPQRWERDSEFIAWLWENKDAFRQDLTEPLFRDYSDNLSGDRRYLDELEGLLANDNLEIRKNGRNFAEAAADVDLIIIDRFLGAAQRPEDENASTDELLAVLEARRENPPLIILMSRRASSPTATEEFRNKSEMFASGFRFLDKRRMSLPGELEYLMGDLSRQRKPYIALSKFAFAWEQGIKKSSSETIRHFRQLDAEDWAQVHDLLLKEEKQSLGSYILELADKLLLHELESNEDLLRQANALTGLSRDEFPPSTATTQKDTFGIIERTQFIHKNRRSQPPSDLYPVMFGDIIMQVSDVAPDDGNPFLSSSVDALLVVTPACDLMRESGAKKVTLLAGRFKPIKINTYNPFLDGIRTPVFTYRDTRVSIDWDKNHIESYSVEELSSLLDGDSKNWEIAGTLRDTEATVIQQAWTGHMSRVAYMARLPATYPVTIRVLYTAPDESLQEIMLDGKNAFEAICYKGNALFRIPLSREIKSAYISALNNIDDTSVHERSRQKFLKAKEAASIARLFEQGIQLNGFNVSPQTLFVSPDNTTAFGSVVCDKKAEDAYPANKRKPAGLIFEILAQ